MLMDRGFQHVRPLEGGLDAWADAGYMIEQRASQGTGGNDQSAHH